LEDRLAQRRVQRLSSVEIQPTKLVEVQAVVNIPAVGGTAPLGDQLLQAQTLEMIGNQIMRFLDLVYQLFDTKVASR
jgi:hypothetical protein